MDRLKVALMGLGDGGRLVAEALLASSWCDLVAVASSQPSRIERFADTHPGIAAYDDFRSLIVENALDALFVALPPAVRPPYLAMAAERGLPVWMLTPPARSFEETLDIAARFERSACPIAVAAAWHGEPAATIRPANIGKLFLARGNVMVCLPEDLDWRGDSVRAGGGVLLDRGYGLLDVIVRAMGTPSTVYCAAAGVSRPQTRFPYDTEDTAALICRFMGGGIATISACWTSGPACWRLALHGTRGSVHIDEQRVTLQDRAGVDQGPPLPRPENPFAAQIDGFLQGLRSNPRLLATGLRSHLPTMATMQAAYLSARTGEAESPGSILRLHAIQETMPSLV